MPLREKAILVDCNEAVGPVPPDDSASRCAESGEGGNAVTIGHEHGLPRTRGDAASLAAGVRRGDRACVARLLSLVEAGEEIARVAVETLAADGERAYTIGITGAPGVGKSSLTDRLVGVIRSLG